MLKRTCIAEHCCRVFSLVTDTGLRESDTFPICYLRHANKATRLSRVLDSFTNEPISVKIIEYHAKEEKSWRIVDVVSARFDGRVTGVVVCKSRPPVESTEKPFRRDGPL